MIRKITKFIGYILLVFVLFTPILSAKAAPGDFYNVTKKTKYQRVDLLSNGNLVSQLETEMDNRDIIGKELPGGKVINYGFANNMFITLLSSMNASDAIISVLSCEKAKIDKQATGIDDFKDAKTIINNNFDVEDIY